ncbi:LytTR family transcriptional regulator DNA-binding domain-containing protein [Paenibacillus chitinolyticus]|uniref:LytTR family transcriptional regulator DNA-binding domain-containing protein n=1 Tax=Paenibacillus chitinolyticus TaxID=79263 RepID=UPI0036714A64
MEITGVKLTNRTGADSDFCTFDAEDDIVYIRLSRKDRGIPDKVVVFQTEFGPVAALAKLESYHELLKDYGFDCLDPSYVVNTKKIKHIKKSPYGNEAFFHNGESVPISRSKTEEYKHLVR